MYKILFLMFALSAVFTSCRTRWKPNNQDTRFVTYISGYSLANQSANGSFRVELAQRPDSILQRKLKDSSYCLTLFDIYPLVKGIAYYDGDRSVYFQPENHLLFGTDYVVAFKLNKLLSVTKELSTFVFKTQTFQQTLSVTETSFQPHDEFDLNYYYYTAHLAFSDVMNTNYIRKHLSLFWNGRKKPFVIQPDYDHHFQVEVDSLIRTKNEGIMEFSWDEQEVKLHDISDKKLILRSLSDYDLSHYDITNEEEQYIMVHFSDALQLNQDLNGLISLDGHFNQDIAIENNSLSIHLKSRLVGNHELKIYKGVKNVAGYPLRHDSLLALSFGDIKPQLRMVQSSGNILPNSQGLFFPFEALGIFAVDVRIVKIFENNTHQFLQVNDLDGSDELRRVGHILTEKKVTLCHDSSTAMNEWRRYVIDLDKIFKADPSGIYRVQLRFKKEYAHLTSITNHTDSDEEESVVDSDESEEEDDIEEGEQGIDDDTYESWSGYDNNLSPDDEEYYRGMGISKNILASNIGLICKKGKNELFLWITDLVSGKPMPHVTCHFLDYQNQEIASSISNEHGFVSVPNSNDLFLIKACSGSQRGYLKLKSKYMNDMSKFDVSGVNADDHVSAFLYTERGVWRPGDSIYMHCILRSGAESLPDSYPINFELENPSGQIIIQRTLKENIQHTYPVYFSTPVQAPTGIYVARIKAGNQVYEKRIPVETVKPNRLKILYEIQDSIYSSWDHRDSIHVHATWLTGASCSGLKAEVSAQYKPDYSFFQRYNDFSFGRMDENSSLEYAELDQRALNEQGDGKIRVNLMGRCKDMLHVNLLSKVFEPGGDYSMDNTVIRYSPFPYYTGIRVGNEGASPYLFINKNYNIQLQTVHQNGKPYGGNTVRFKVYCFTNTWWWQESEIGVEDYTGRVVKIGIKDTNLVVPEQGVTFPFNARRAGRYLFICEDVQTKQSSSCIRFFDEQYWEGNHSQLQEGASQLLLSSNKKSYVSGEQVTVSIPNTSEGSALITLEKGSKMIRSEWIATQEGNTYYTFKSEAWMRPNIYVHVTYVRPHILTAKKMPLRMFGVLPVMITDENTVLHPMIICPTTVEPSKEFTVEVKERNGHEMTYSLVLVDEGLLDINHFKTPNAWQAFYAKQKLDIKTWDDYSEVIGAYSGSLNTKLNIGGDGTEEEDSYENKTNRFRPVVQCLGLFHSSGKANRHKIILPHYMGKVKCMVVASNAEAYGEVEQSVIVNQDLMILPTLPRVLMPGNHVMMPVSVLANEPSVKHVKLNVITDSSVECMKKNVELQFTHMGEQLLEFPLEVKNKMGKTRIIIQAVSGTHSCLDTIFLDIVAPHASRFDQHSYTLGSGSYTDLSFIPKGYSGSYQAVVTLSTLPESGFERRLEYLLQYPHGCVEQTTYTAFPQLYLSSVMDLNDSTQKQCGNHIQKAIERLASFQTVTGGFAYWPGSNYEDAYASCYVGEFLSEAEKKGYPVTPYMKNRLLSYLTERSNASGVEGDVVIAYRLYVLANWNQPNMGAMNRMKEGGGYSLDARVYLAKAYAQCQQMNLVGQLLGGLSKKNFQTNENYFQTAFTQEVEWLDVLRLCGDSRAESQMKYIIQLNNRTAQLNTKECATFLKSYCQFYSQATDKTIHIRYTMNGKTVELNSGKKLYRLKIRGERIHLENKGDELYVNGEEQYVPDTESEAVASKELFLKVTYWGMDGKPMDIKQLYQGTDVRVRIEMENKTEYTMDYMSLQYTLSPGWQMLRVEDESEDNRQSHRHIGDYFYRYYFQLPSHQKRQTTFVVNATYKGKYILPKVWVESMYQAKLRSESPAVPLSVVEQK